MVARLKLLDCQKSLSQSFQQSAKLYLGRLPTPLEKYSFEYFKELRSYQKITHKTNILRETLRSQIVLCGDYHSLSQAQRTVIRILREILPRLKKEKKPLYLGLEALRVKDNIRVQQYLRGEISESKFLKSVAFEEWGFHWQNYAPLFDLAKKWGVPIIGLSPNRSSSPEARDKFAANLLSNWTEKNPQSVLLALIGDFHLAQKHLPLQLKRELEFRKVKRRVLTIHQNSDSLYWKVTRKHQGKSVEVLQLKKDIFCILNTAPWIKIQSYLSWMDHLYAENFDPSFEMTHLLQSLARFLGGEKLDNLHSDYELKYDKLSALSAWICKDKGLSKRQKRLLKKELQDSKYLLLRDRQTLLLTSSNLNHLSVLSSQYLHSQLSGLRDLIGTPNKDFYQFLWVEALGYLGSKIINPKRKCKGLYDFKSSSEPTDKKVFRHIQIERAAHSRKKLDRLSHSTQNYPVAKLLGKLLGQGIFDLMVQNKVSLSEIQELFRNPFTETPRELYLQWAKRLDANGVRDFSYRDQL